MSIRSLIIFFWITYLFPSFVFAQAPDDNILNQKNLKEQLPPLELLISAASKNSPLLKRQNSEILMSAYRKKALNPSSPQPPKNK